MLFGLAAVVVAMIIATGATAVGGNEVAWNDVGALEIGKFGLLQASSILQGLAFGMLILNSSGAIASFFILPTALLIATSAWSVLSDAAPWIVMGTASQPLTEVGALSGNDWVHLGVASLIWIVVPLAAGLVRVLQKEVK
jgi:ABC-2 type transport system permease protein